MKNKILFVLLLTMTFLCSSCKGNAENITKEDAAVEQADKISTISIAAVGDIMMHGPQIKSAYDKRIEDYNFEYMFSSIAPWLQNTDITIGNIETTFAGKEKRYSGYPTFNSPEVLLKYLNTAGFDILSTANNHCMDRGTYGIEKTISNIDSYKILHTGTYSTTESAIQPLIINKKDIKLGIASYTYGLNGFSLPDDKKFMVNIINKEKIIKDLSIMSEKNVDIKIIVLHFGNEYQRHPTDEQKELVDSLFEAGADIVLGSHPHVLQPTIYSSLSNGKKVFAIYSMGNFISNQRERYQDAGIIVNIKASKNFTTNSVTIDDVSFIPTWVQKKNGNGLYTYRILNIADVIQSYTHGENKYAISQNEFTYIKQVYNDTTGLINEYNTTYSAINVKY